MSTPCRAIGKMQGDTLHLNLDGTVPSLKKCAREDQTHCDLPTRATRAMCKEFDQKALLDELGLLSHGAQSAICTHPECQEMWWGRYMSTPCHAIGTVQGNTLHLNLNGTAPSTEKKRKFDKTRHMVICQAGPMSITEFGVLACERPSMLTSTTTTPAHLKLRLHENGQRRPRKRLKTNCGLQLNLCATAQLLCTSMYKFCKGVGFYITATSGCSRRLVIWKLPVGNTATLISNT